MFTLFFFSRYEPIETDPPLSFKPGYTLNMTVEYIYTARIPYRASILDIDTVLYTLVMDRPNASKDTSCPKSRICLFNSVLL